MKELDVLLERWLGREAAEAAPDVLARFEALLELQDPQLARYLLAGDPHPDAGFRTLIASIRHDG